MIPASHSNARLRSQRGRMSRLILCGMAVLSVGVNNGTIMGKVTVLSDDSSSPMCAFAKCDRGGASWEDSAQ